MKVYLILFLLLLIPFVSADIPQVKLGYSNNEIGSYSQIFKYDDKIDLKIQCLNNGTFCPENTECNITVTYPDNTIFINNELMTNQFSYFNYTLSNDTAIYLAREYQCSIICCKDDLCGSQSSCSFILTGNGKQSPGTGIIVLFILFFIFILFGLTYTLIHMIGHVFTLDYDLLDTAFSIGIYFSILGLDLLQRIYLGSPELRDWFTLFINVGLYTHLIIPLISLFFVLTAGQFIKKKIFSKGREE